MVGSTIVPAPPTKIEAEARAINRPKERHPVFVMAAGTDEIHEVVRVFRENAAEQSSRRAIELTLDEIPLKRIKNGPRAGQPFYFGLPEFIEALQQAIGFNVNPRLVELDMLKRHYKAGSRHWGRVAFIVKRAARLLLRERRRNTGRQLADYFAPAFAQIYKLPPERNPYLVADVDAAAFPPSPHADADVFDDYASEDA